jgi:hypothetical protein
MIDLLKVRQLDDQHHGRLANGQEHALASGIHHAPSGPPGKETNPALAVAEANNQQLWVTGLVADGGDRRQLQVRAERHSIWARACWVDGPRSQRLCDDDRELR